jgi:pyruvate,water dikinase
MLLYLEARRVLLELGHRLGGAGGLGRPEDLFMLTVGEVQALVQGELEAAPADLVERRRLRRLAAASRPAQDMVSADGRPKLLIGRTKAPPTERVVVGLGAVPGIVRGPVRMLRRARDAASIRPGEVLVLASTDVGSTLLFPVAAAMVVEEGGLLSHASVLAREYGLPTVVQATGAADRLYEGAMVEVDGGRGLVTLLDQA